MHVVGTGTIGEPLIHLLAGQRKDIGIGEVSFHKRTPLIEEIEKVRYMMEKGAVFSADEDQFSKFAALGLKPNLSHEEALKRADVIIDCTPAGNQNKEKYYNALSRNFPKKGFIAQGSEENFGKPYIWTINDPALNQEKDRFLQVVSCNTHNLACIVNTIVIAPDGLENLERCNSVIVRRGSNISEDKTVPGAEAEALKKKYAPYGSHQAYDAVRVFKTFLDAKEIPLHSQVLKISSQYMHVGVFTLDFRNPRSFEEIFNRLKDNPLVAFSHIKSTNKIVGRARDASKIQGRILNQTVLYQDALEVSENGKTVYGVYFTPQDGNALLSSVAATLWLLDPKTYKEKMRVFDKYLFKMI